MSIDLFILFLQILNKLQDEEVFTGNYYITDSIFWY